MTVANPQTTCACPSCNCTVSPEKSIVKDGKLYCCEACANGHPNGQACAMSGCGCHA
jgi:metallothionein